MDRLKKITPFILLIVVLGLNTYLHLFPAYFPQLKKQAKLNIENQAFRQASQFVQHKYPNFNRLLQEKIIKGIVKDGKAKQRFRDAIEKEYQRLKGPYQDEDGQTYFLEVDPYCRLRFTRLVLENGYPGNKKIDGEVYDTFMLAPKGSPVPPPRFLYYCSAYLYKVYSLVFPQVSLEKFLFYLPLFFTLIFFISLFLFCRYFFSSMSGVLAVFFIGLSPVFIHRSCVGWFDQDALNVLFPILIVWCLGLSLEKKTFISIAKYSLLASLLLGLYAFSWIGWWFILAVIIIFFASSLANHFCLYFKDKATLIEKSFPYLVSSGLFLAGSVIFCLLIAKTEPFSFLIYSLGKNLQLGSSSSSSIWPSVLYTVSELKGGNPKTIPIYTGGWTIFMLSLFSLLGIYLSNRRSKKADIVLLLSYWAFVMFFASLKGLRFTQFLFVPLGIFLGVGLTQIWQLFPSGLRYLKNRKQKIAVTIVAISLVCALLSIPIQRGISQASVQFPIVNDGWYNLMLKIKQETPKNSVINSWWDYGNWFKEIAQRATIVDPQIQDVPVTHWMARVFLTDNEEEAVRILRMINNSSDKLFDEIRSFLGDDFTTIAFLNRILKLKLSEVEPVLKAYRIPKGLAQKIKDAVFIKTPAPAYLFIDSGMIYKTPSISFLGNWNFAKVYILKHRDMPEDKVISNLSGIFDLEPKEAQLLYKEVMFSRLGKEVNQVASEQWTFPLHLAKGNESDGMVYFGNGVILELNKFKAKMFDPSERLFKNLKFVFVFDGDKLTYQEAKDSKVASFKSGGFFFKSDDQWHCIGVSDKRLGQSLFSKLYFTKAKGLKYLEPFIADEKANLYAFKINWSGK